MLRMVRSIGGAQCEWRAVPVLCMPQRVQRLDAPFAMRAEHLDRARTQRGRNLFPEEDVLRGEACAAAAAGDHVFGVDLALHAGATVATRYNLHRGKSQMRRSAHRTPQRRFSPKHMRRRPWPCAGSARSPRGAVLVFGGADRGVPYF